MFTQIEMQIVAGRPEPFLDPLTEEWIDKRIVLASRKTLLNVGENERISQTHRQILHKQLDAAIEFMNKTMEVK